MRISANADSFAAVSAEANIAPALPPARIENIELRSWMRNCFTATYQTETRGQCRQIELRQSAKRQLCW
jgi:hypothetical protein